MKPEKNRKQDVIDDLFKKKCHNSWSRSKLINYLQSVYGYTYETSVTYYEDMMKFLKENVTVDYETDLAQAVEWMEHHISIEENSFIRLQHKKELNKIKGLHITKISVQGNINVKDITTIELIEVKKPTSIDESVKNPLPIEKLNPLNDELSVK